MHMAEFRSTFVSMMASGGLLEIIFHPNFPSIRTFDTACCCWSMQDLCSELAHLQLRGWLPTITVCQVVSAELR